MLVNLMDELANRAGFTWRDSFGIYDGPKQGDTWTDLLDEMVDNGYPLNTEPNGNLSLLIATVLTFCKGVEISISTRCLFLAPCTR